MHTLTCLFLLAATALTTVLPDHCLAPLPPSHYELLHPPRQPNRWWLHCLPPAKNVSVSSSTPCPRPDSPPPTPHPPADPLPDKSLSTWQVLCIVGEELWQIVRESGLEILQSYKEQRGRAVEYDDNFASLNGGAMVLRKSSSRIHLAQAILQDSSDRYLYTDEQLPIEITIALKEEVSIHRVRLKSSEIYSSTIKDFILEGAFAVDADGDDPSSPEENWFKLLEARARHHGHQQEFRTTNKVIRFLRLRILSKYGDWKYFTLTQLKVYGRGLFAEAMTDYQQVHSVMGPEPEPRHLQLEDGLGEIYRMTRSDVGKKPDQNMLTFLIERVDNLSRVEEHQILYMNNLKVQLEALARERDQQEAVNKQLARALAQANLKNQKLQKNSDAFASFLTVHLDILSLKEQINNNQLNYQAQQAQIQKLNMTHMLKQPEQQQNVSHSQPTSHSVPILTEFSYESAISSFIVSFITAIITIAFFKCCTHTQPQAVQVGTKRPTKK